MYQRLFWHQYLLNTSKKFNIVMTQGPGAHLADFKYVNTWTLYVFQFQSLNVIFLILNPGSTECHEEVPAFAANRQLYNKRPPTSHPKPSTPTVPPRWPANAACIFITERWPESSCIFFNSSNPQGSFKDTKNTFSWIFSSFFFFF